MRNLKIIRLQNEMTQKELSAKSGVSQAYINELENGKKINPSIFILSKIAAALGTSISELLDDDIDANKQFFCREEYGKYQIAL